jgi:hypothetical protein
MNKKSIGNRSSINFTQIMDLNNSSIDNKHADTLMDNDGVMITLRTENNENDINNDVVKRFEMLDDSPKSKLTSINFNPMVS